VSRLSHFHLSDSDSPAIHSLIRSTAIAQVFELLIGTATVDLDLLGRSIRERQLQDVRHVAREHNYPSDTGPRSGRLSARR
jgi:hypothetical protein